MLIRLLHRACRDSPSCSPSSDLSFVALRHASKLRNEYPLGSRMVDETDIRNRERRLRRVARTQGLVLRKSRRRDPRVSDFGTYSLIDPAINGLLCSGASLEVVEIELAEIARRSLSARGV